MGNQDYPRAGSAWSLDIPSWDRRRLRRLPFRTMQCFGLLQDLSAARTDVSYIPPVACQAKRVSTTLKPFKSLSKGSFGRAGGSPNGLGGSRGSRPGLEPMICKPAPVKVFRECRANSQGRQAGRRRSHGVTSQMSKLRAPEARKPVAPVRRGAARGGSGKRPEP
jgi:hypothetical protein